MSNKKVKEMSFGETIRYLRETNNFTKKEVAEYVSCSQTYIADIEKKNKIPGDNIIVRLAELLKYNKKQLIFLAKREATVPEAKALFEIQEELSERELINDYFLTILTFKDSDSMKIDVPVMEKDKKNELSKNIWDEIDKNYSFTPDRRDFLLGTDDLKLSVFLKYSNKSDKEIIEILKQLISLVEYNIEDDSVHVTLKERAKYNRSDNVEPAHLGHLIDIPLLTWIQAGDMSDYDDRYPYPGCSDEYISTDLKGEHLFALRVKGDSMTPKFIEGDVVIVNPEMHASNGDYVVVKDLVRHEAMLKQLKTYSNNVTVLHPLNPVYQDVEFNKDYVIIGRVVRKQTNL